MNKFTIKGENLNYEGMIVRPDHVDPSIDDDGMAQHTLWSDDAEVTVQVHEDAVTVTSVTTETTSKYVYREVTSTMIYRCPVKIHTCTPDFSVFDDKEDTYVGDWGMFSAEGDAAIQQGIDDAVAADKKFIGVDAILSAIDRICGAASKIGHKEAFDSVVREKVYLELERLELARD